MRRASKVLLPTRVRIAGRWCKFIQMPRSERKKERLADSSSNQPDDVQTLHAAAQAIAELAPSASRIAAIIEHLQRSLNTVEIFVDWLDNPDDQILLREQHQQLRAALSVAGGKLHREIQELRALHLAPRAGLKESS